VLDVACGTGLSFQLLEEAIGPSGRLISIEQSPEMLALAERRVAAHGWENVTLIGASAEAANIPMSLDAILFHYTHDVLRSRPSLENIFSKAKPGARVAVAGAKYCSWWLAPVNLVMMIRARNYLTTFEGLRRPWSLLEQYVGNLTIVSTLFGTGYIGVGTRDSPREPAARTFDGTCMKTQR
jgi:ubiquinone/menaquinone biosynthesis C-methylase UbiE